jgi:MFS family permease
MRGLRLFPGARSPTVTAVPTDPSSRMTPAERRASASLAMIYAARMLGFFLVLPVFALEAARYPGGDNPALVGLGMGMYGLTQGLLQIAYGIASDRFGRKPVIVAGLLVFAAGSFLAAWAPTVHWLIVARAVQGAGAVSAAVTALLADLTRDTVRTKAMALVGASIGLTFAISLVAAPLLDARIGLHGLFILTGLLALACIAMVLWWTPSAPQKAHPGARSGSGSRRGSFAEVVKDPALLRLDVGVFALHATQTAMWFAVPALLVQAGLPKAQHWWVYLPAVLASFFVMGGALFPLERRGYLRAVFLSAVGLVALVEVGLAVSTDAGVVWLGVLLFLFFCGFNTLEATQPSLASRLAPAHARGAALGVYNTLQSLGSFAGGAVGGWLAKGVGVAGLFGACAALMVVWLVVAWPMQAPQARQATPEEVLADEAEAT